MKKAFALLLAALLCCASAALAQDAPVSDVGKEYTLQTKGMTVLAGERAEPLPDGIPTSRPVAPAGESPVTGLALAPDAPYLPMLVQISNAEGAAINQKGGNVTAAGLGKRAPWGLQSADILYETLLESGGYTRFTALFSDNVPTSVGPVRSYRMTASLLRQEWGGGLIFSGMTRVDREYVAKTENSAMLLELNTKLYTESKRRVKGVKAPDNYDVNARSLQATLAAETAPRAFSFFDQCPYGDRYAPAGLVMLDWGKKVTRSSFVYDPAAHRYLRFAGAKGGGAPFSSFASADDRAPEHMEQLGFENLIIQRVNYEYVNQWKLCPRAQCVGAGYADIFIDGRYIPGFWVRQSAESPTVFLDDQGNELLLRRGKTYIALLSPTRLLAYAALSGAT